jgi:hypothetical protein
MSVDEIAANLVALCRAGDFDTPGRKYWADDVLSVEAMGPERESRGRAAAEAKGDWWNRTHQVENTEVHGPYVNGDQFAVRFVMDVLVKATGERRHMDEVALYSVKDGRIAEERFFYGP